MINVENKVYEMVSTACKNRITSCSTYSDYVETPSSFPCVTIVEEDNTTYAPTVDTSSNENHCEVMYSVNIFTNLASGKKSQAKGLSSTVDDTMRGMGFRRISMAQIPNVDRTIYRITMRYTAIISQGVTSGTTTKYYTSQK